MTSETGNPSSAYWIVGSRSWRKLIVPNRRQLLAPGGLRHVSDGFTGYDGEYGGFLGIPLLALLIWAGRRLRRRALVPALVLVVAAALSLGAELHVWGHDTGIPLPWKVARHLPLMTGAVPTRFNLYVWLCTAALIALLVDDLRRRPPVAGRAVAWSLTALALIPIIPAPAPSQRFKVPRVVVRVADPGRAAWYAEQGLLTICPTQIAIDQAERLVLAP